MTNDASGIALLNELTVKTGKNHSLPIDINAHRTLKKNHILRNLGKLFDQLVILTPISNL